MVTRSVNPRYNIATRSAWINRLHSILKAEKPDVLVNAIAAYDYHGVSKVIESNLNVIQDILSISNNLQIEKMVIFNTFFSKPSFISATEPTPYNVTKLLQTRLAASAPGPTSIIEFYLEHMYGVGDRSEKFVPWLIQNLTENKKIKIQCPNDLRDFIYVADVCGAVEAVMRLPASAKYISYELGHARPMTIRNFVQTAKEITKSKSEICFHETPNKVVGSWANINQRPPNWMPRVTVDDGLRLILNEKT